MSGHLGMAPIDGAWYVVFIIAKTLTYDCVASCSHAITQTGASLNSAKLVALPVAASAHCSLGIPCRVVKAQTCMPQVEHYLSRNESFSARQRPTWEIKHAPLDLDHHGWAKSFA